MREVVTSSCINQVPNGYPGREFFASLRKCCCPVVHQLKAERRWNTASGLHAKNQFYGRNMATTVLTQRSHKMTMLDIIGVWISIDQRRLHLNHILSHWYWTHTMSVDEVFLSRILFDYYGSPHSSYTSKPIQGNKFTPNGSRLDSSGCTRLVQMENNLIEQNITDNAPKKCKNVDNTE